MVFYVSTMLLRSPLKMAFSVPLKSTTVATWAKFRGGRVRICAGVSVSTLSLFTCNVASGVIQCLINPALFLGWCDRELKHYRSLES